MASELNEEFFNSILEDNREAVRERVRDALLEGVTRQFQWELPETVKKAVTEFMNEEVIPQVRAELEANKDEFVNAASAMVRGVPAEIGKAMQAQLATNLTNSWTLRKIVEACFQ